LTFQTKALVPPKLIIADIGVQDSNNNGRIDAGEVVELTIRAQNIGHGDARQVKAIINLGENVFVAGDSTTQHSIGNISLANLRILSFLFILIRKLAMVKKYQL
jgi:hypothetical protein